MRLKKTCSVLFQRRAKKDIVVRTAATSLDLLVSIFRSEYDGMKRREKFKGMVLGHLNFVLYFLVRI